MGAMEYDDSEGPVTSDDGWGCSSRSNESSHDCDSMTCMGREDSEAIPGGDTELSRDVGESAADDSRLEWKLNDWVLLPSYTFGLSLPVGPFPRGGRLDGGRLRAWRRQEFSSSSSDTLCSKA